MRLTNEFDSALSVEHLWDLLTDAQQRSEILSGVDLRLGEDGLHRGTIELAVGHDPVRYDATVTTVDLDRGDGVCVVGVEGAGTSGHGDLSATVTLRLTESGQGSVVHLEADVQVTGKVAQMGRGALGDASNHLVRQLDGNLAHHAADSCAGNPPPLVEQRQSPTRPADSAQTTSLVQTVPLIATVAFLVLLWRWLRRRRAS